MKIRQVPGLNMLPKFLVLLKVSRPPLWLALPLVFAMGLAYGAFGLMHPAFRFKPLILLQMFLLSFPFCLFTFGLNDIQDEASDRINPRKKGVEGRPLTVAHHKLVRNAAFLCGIVFFCVSVATMNPVNMYFAVTILVLSYVYSTPPWRLKTRPPFDALSAGIIGFYAPFALGYSFAGDATVLPFQAYYFTCCVMGFHAFSTIGDYEVDRRSGDRTFAVAYGKRTAALFPAAIFLFSHFFVHAGYVRAFFTSCAVLCLVVAVVPSERMARYFFAAIFVGTVAVVAFWVVPFLL